MPYCYKWSAWRRWLPLWFNRTIRAFPLRMFFARGRKGYAPSDLWSFDLYLGRVIGKGLLELAETTHSHPHDIEWPEWERQLRETSNKLLDWNDVTFLDPDAYHGAQRGMQWVAEHYGDLWD